MQFHAVSCKLQYVYCSSILSLKVLHIDVVQVAWCTLSEPRDETMRWLLTVGGLLWEVSIIVTGKILVF